MAITNIAPNNPFTGFGSNDPNNPSGWNVGGRIQPRVSPTTQFGNPATFTAAANKQASDYDTIMKNYTDIAASANANPLTATPVTAPTIAPQTSNYSQSGDVTSSLSNLKNLSDTGGYSEADKADIRERDISPTRAIYAQGQQELERNRSLSGGYSPNFAAASAQMARDESQKISDIDTAANAGIAQNVASNRIAAASPYASASSTANAAKTASDQKNADIINSINEANANRSTQVGEFNTQAKLDAARTNTGTAMGATQGMASLYGTTPALTNTFGNQVMQANAAGQNQQQLNNRRIAAFAGWG